MSRNKAEEQWYYYNLDQMKKGILGYLLIKRGIFPWLYIMVLSGIINVIYYQIVLLIGKHETEDSQDRNLKTRIQADTGKRIGQMQYCRQE